VCNKLLLVSNIYRHSTYVVVFDSSLRFIYLFLFFIYLFFIYFIFYLFILFLYFYIFYLFIYAYIKIDEYGSLHQQFSTCGPWTTSGPQPCARWSAIKA